MQFIDLGRQYQKIKEDVDQRLQAVVDAQHFIMGPEVQELEETLAAYVGRKHCLTCSSGTSALFIPLFAYGLKETDAVFVSSFTYFASAETVNLAGGTPVFVDSDETYNLDPELLEQAIEKTIQEGKLTPRGIVAVDLFGLMPDYERLEQIAKKYDLFLLADAAQSFGAARNGKKSCAYGDVAATSFFPAKPLGCYGDGGAIFTDNDALYELMASIRVHGHGASKYDNVRIGINGRLDTMQAAVLLAKLPVLDEERRRKNEIAKQYTERLQGAFHTPIIPEGCETALAQYTLMARDEKQREAILSGMKAKNIPTMIYYQTPMHMQTAYAYLGYKPEDLPNSADYSSRVFSLPMHAYLTEEEIDEICDTLLALVR